MTMHFKVHEVEFGNIKFLKFRQSEMLSFRMLYCNAMYLNINKIKRGLCDNNRKYEVFCIICAEANRRGIRKFCK